MSRAAELPTVPFRSLGRLVLPWVLSSTVHAAALVMLVVTWEWVGSRTRPDGGTSLGGMPTITLGGGSDSDRAGADADGPPSAGYFDDELPVATAAEPRPGGGPPLHDLLNEPPHVSLAGVLPAPHVEAGVGGPAAGLGSAVEAAGQPARGSGQRGGYARTGVFGAVGEGNKFIYVFDRSGSMDGHGGTPLSAAKNELLASLDNLGQTHQFQIIFYNEEPRVFNPAGRSGRLVFGTDQNKQLARRFVGSITASGATRHLEALKMALRMNPDVIFFLTDADEPRMSPQELSDIAQANAGTTINAIEFGYGSQLNRDNFLVALARQNGGQHVYVDVSKLAGPRP